jgi:hypothetical protein
MIRIGTDDELPPLPSPRIQKEVEFKLAEREMCMVAGREAMDRYQQRQPHAVMSFSRIARLLKIGFDFGKLACGLEIINPLPEKITYDYELTDLKRAYGHEPETPEVANETGGASVPASRSPSADMMPAASGAGGPPQGLPASRSPGECNPPSVQAGDVGVPPQGPRCDAWSRWDRTMRRMKS